MKFIILSLFILPAFALAQSGDDLSKTLRDAKMVPVVRDGKVVRYSPVKLKKNGKMEKLGFKEMDAVKSINGETVDSPAKAMEFYNKTNGKKTMAKVVRDGRKTTITLPTKAE